MKNDEINELKENIKKVVIAKAKDKSELSEVESYLKQKEEKWRDQNEIKTKQKVQLKVDTRKVEKWKVLFREMTV